MPFNPAVADRSADYIFEGLQQAQQFAEANRLQEQRAMQQNVAQAMEAVGTAAQQWRADATKTAAVDGRVEGIASMVQADARNADLFGGADVVHKLLSERNTDKRAGMLAVALQSYDQATANRNRLGMLAAEQSGRLAMQDDQQAFLQAQADAARRENRTGQTTTVTDPVTGQKVGLYYQNNNQVAPFKTGTVTDATAMKRVDIGNGQFIYVDAKGRPVPKSSVMGDGNSDPVLAQKITTVRKDLAAIDGEMAGDPSNIKPGLDWWPFSRTYAQQRAAKAAELETLTGGAAGVPAPSGPAVISPPQDGPAQKPAAPKYQEGKRARGPKGDVLVFRNGNWVPE